MLTIGTSKCNNIIKKPSSALFLWLHNSKGWFVGKPEVGGAFVWRFCTSRLSAKLHIDGHARLIANSPKWENYEEKSRRVSAMRHRPTDCRLQAAGEGVEQLDNKLVVWRTSNRDSRYVKNAAAVFNLSYHIVFCPKYRRKVLVGKSTH
jgi:hypothetical protein